MKKINDYSEKLKHPKWQKKRLEIMQRDEFMCQLCGDTENNLNIHHKIYLKNTEIWDYDNISLYEELIEILYYLNVDFNSFFSMQSIIKSAYNLIPKKQEENDETSF